MQVSVSGKHLDVGDALRGHVEARLGNGVSKYFDRAIEAAVQFSKERHLFRCDISVHAGRGLALQAHGEADEAYPSFDMAADRIEKRLRRFKRRLTDHRAVKPGPEEQEMRARETLFAAAADDNEEPNTAANDASGDAPVTVAETETRIHALTVSEAVMRLELAELPVLMFRNSAHGGLNVVYRRRDGNIGWIDPVEA